MKSYFLRILSITSFSLIFTINLFAQTGGKYVYDFLTLPYSARASALGSNFAAIHDHDLNLALANPSLITPLMQNNLSLNFVKSYTGSSFGAASYGFGIKEIGTFAASLQYIGYGKFDNIDENGQNLGQFSAGEYAFNVGWGRTLDTIFTIGANLKTIYSSLETYHSFGVAVDVAGSYVPNENFCASILFRNIGRQITAYTSSGTEPLPFEIQAGISKKLAHVPFRYSLLLQHLEKWDLSFVDPNAAVDPFTGAAIKKTGIDAFGSNVLRHIVIGGEFIPAKFLSIRLGYNYLRREEMKVASRPGMVGFSWGLGIRVSKFTFNYSRAAFHLAGSPNYISVSTNLGDWKK